MPTTSNAAMARPLAGLDPMRCFICAPRGIPRKEARALLIRGFIGGAMTI